MKFPNGETQSQNTMIYGTYTEFQVDACQAEIRSDIIVRECTTVRVWGQVKTPCGVPVSNVLLKLVRVTYDCNKKCQYEGIAHTMSDKNGFYQFDVCAREVGACYRILAHKSAIGPERKLVDTDCFPGCPSDCSPDYFPGCHGDDHCYCPQEQPCCEKEHHCEKEHRRCQL